jgi:hypothetical protein
MPDSDGMRTRSRIVPAPISGKASYKRTDILYHISSGTQEQVSGGNENFPIPPLPSGTQITVSKGNQWPPRKGTLTDAGGNFDTTIKRVETDVSPKTLTRPYFEYYREMSFNGQFVVASNQRKVVNETPLLACNPSVDLPIQPFPDSGRSSNSDLNEKGATAIARCKPTNSAADLSVFLGEFVKDGLPSLIGARTWKDRTLSAKNAGDEYLNFEFGWRPLVNDIRKLANGIVHAEKILSQYERDAGKVVRRRYRFPLQTVTHSETIATERSPLGYLHSDVTDGAIRSRLIREEEILRDVWFSGAFTYHLPSGYDSRNKLSRCALFAKKTLGLNLTPEVLWNLAPWSWAIDWFGNVGDVLANVSDAAQDGLVMRYGYIMEHTVSRVTYSLPDFRFQYSPEVKVPPLSFVTSTKVRRQANPFGFGFSWDGLSPRQLAILLALGITRGSS